MKPIYQLPGFPQGTDLALMLAKADTAAADAVLAAHVQAAEAAINAKEADRG